MFNATGQIYRATAGDANSRNEKPRAFAVVGTARCRVDDSAAGSINEVVTGKQLAERTALIFMEPSADITEKDRLLVNGRTFEIKRVYKNPGGVVGHHIELDATEYKA